MNTVGRGMGRERRSLLRWWNLHSHDPRLPVFPASPSYAAPSLTPIFCQREPRTKSSPPPSRNCCVQFIHLPPYFVTQDAGSQLPARESKGKWILVFADFLNQLSEFHTLPLPQDRTEDPHKVCPPRYSAFTFPGDGETSKFSERERHTKQLHAGPYLGCSRERAKWRFSSHILLRSLYASSLEGSKQFAHLPFPISRPSVGTFYKELITLTGHFITEIYLENQNPAVIKP